MHYFKGDHAEIHAILVTKAHRLPFSKMLKTLQKGSMGDVLERKEGQMFGRIVFEVQRGHKR